MADSNIFQKILDEAKREGVVPDRSQGAKDWFRNRAGDVSEVSTHELLDNTAENRLFRNVSLGGLYLFQYDPKLKEKLPYYDTSPLVFPVEWSQGGFTGLNLHYLPPMHRAGLMDNLYKITTSSASGDMKLRANYALLNGLGDMKAFKPCYKRYLYGFIQSEFLFIDPKEWDIALFLPLGRFQKSDATRIYNDSLAKIGRRKKRVF